jgi:hypothetical protein
MTKNCSAPISKQQKLLLKVLNCLWVQYVSQRTPNVKIFCANPSQETYQNAVQEVNAISVVLNLSDGVATLNTPSGLPAYTTIVVTNADGVVAIDSSFPVSPSSYFNTYDEYLERIVSGMPNLATRKPIQNLNVDECLQQALQIKPALSLNTNQCPTSSEIPVVWATQASIFERTGCPGVSNTGFIGLSLEVDISAFPFKACPNPSLNCTRN